MSNQQTAPTTSAPRPNRVEQERAQRRRRDDMSDDRLRNLNIAGKLDPDYTYRFINDEPGRVHKLTALDDWDIVNASELEPNAKDKGVGSQVERIVDRRSGQRAILVRKRKEYYAADKAKEQAQIDDLEKSIKQGAAPGPEALREGSYVPQGGIRIDSPGGYKP
ncbi:hypothetical protein [Caudoviricetes sp.]|nr:hypothetical protein [Caudoviricetes sp.]